MAESAVAVEAAAGPPLPATAAELAVAVSAVAAAAVFESATVAVAVETVVWPFLPGHSCGMAPVAVSRPGAATPSARQHLCL